MIGLFLGILAILAMIVLLLYAFRRPGPDQIEPGPHAGQHW